jgi:general secretion pathway protein G
VPPRGPEARRRSEGFTLVELALAFAIVTILASLGTQSYLAYLERARVAAAKGDLRSMAEELSGRMAEQDPLPDTLDGIGWGDHLDPWGHPYHYVPIAGHLKGGGPGGGGGGGTTIGELRKDRFLVPINTDYDLYSAGADGETTPPLTAKKSQDDVIRANNGDFYGLASEY